MRVTLLGNEIDFPVCVAPTSTQGYLHWEGEIATARGKFYDTLIWYLSCMMMNVLTL